MKLEVVTETTAWHRYDSVGVVDQTRVFWCLRDSANGATMPEDLAETAEDVARGRGISVNALELEALEAEIDRVKLDDGSMDQLHSPAERNREILDRLAQGDISPPLRRSQSRRKSRVLMRGLLCECRESDFWSRPYTPLRPGFGDVEFYPEFVDKAAVLVVHIAPNHPLPDGNKRLAWMALTMFCALNGRHLTVATDEAVALMLGIASGEKNEGDVAAWLAERVRSSNG
ncbi:MAG: type II toxin-antitoxin system death-on-curing family toxin [Acidimicrobiia bacterium]